MLLIITIFTPILRILSYKNNFHTSNYSNFISDVKKNKIKEVTIKNKNLYVIKKNNFKYQTYIPEKNSDLLNRIINKKIKIKIIHINKYNFFKIIFLLWNPIFIISFLIWFFIIRKIKIGKVKDPLSFGKSKARKYNKKNNNITFKNVAGCQEAKEEVHEIIEFLKNPNKFKKLGGKIPKGILMIGPPGTGKTLLAKAIAGEAKVEFFIISGSDFVELFVGIGASRVRNMFREAKKKSPCIIFIDEIDAVGKKRSININGHDEREQTLNQMLVEMDGFNSDQGIIIIAATNRPDILDPALLRPGRFDRQVIIDLPDIQGRKEIFKIHTQNKPLNKNVNISIIARGTPGFSGADIANLINEAALLAAQKNLKNISMKEFEKAKDKIIMGAERKSLIINNKEKEITAYHESGHAIVGLLIKEHDPIHKITIIPRGKALGVTCFIPENDNVHVSKKKLESKISTLYGGRLAEEIIYGPNNISIGSTNDIKVATEIAKKMVTQWGLSKKLGPLFYENYEENSSIKDNLIIKQYKISEYTAKIIDQEIKKIIRKNYKKAKNIILKNINLLHKIKEKLIKHETLSSKKIKKIIFKKK